jgi:hypothetical protein
VEKVMRRRQSWFIILLGNQAFILQDLQYQAELQGLVRDSSRLLDESGGMELKQR